MDDIQKEADQVFADELAKAKADGLKGRKAADRANAARKAHVDAEVAKNKAGGKALPKPSGSVDAAPAGKGTQAAAAPAPSGDLPPVDGNVDPATGGAAPNAAAGQPTGPAAGPNAAPNGAADLTPASGTLDGSQPSPQESRLQRIRNAAWKWSKRAGLTAGAIYVGGRLLDGLSRSDGGDVHVPPPGAGGGAGGGKAPPNGFPPVPPGGQAGAADPQAAAEAEINAALEAMDRGENLNWKPPQYQTFQNYNQWN
jgi:hypothetical protein